MKMKKCLYIKVTKDEYELPLFVAENAKEMAKHEGISENNVYSSVSHYEHGRSNSSYRRVYLEESES